MSSDTPENKSNDSRSKLIATAAKLFAGKGFSGVSTRDIAKAADVNISLISYYFSGKEGLYQAILQDFVDQNRAEYVTLVEGFDLTQMTKDSFSSHMKLLIGRILTRKFENPHVSPLLFREVMAGEGDSHKFVEEKMGSMADGLIKIFETAQAKGIIKPDLHAATLFFSMMQTMDAYTLTSKRFSPLAKRCFSLPEENDKYIDQVHMIFIEGALT